MRFWQNDKQPEATLIATQPSSGVVGENHHQRRSFQLFHEVINEYLKRINFGDDWATELVLPVTERPLLRVVPEVAGGDALFMEGGAPLSAVRSRAQAGEPIDSIAADYATPAEDIREALSAIWPTKAAA